MTKWVCFPVVSVHLSTTPSRKATSSSEIFPVSPAAPCSSLASSAPRENSRPWMRWTVVRIYSRSVWAYASPSMELASSMVP